MRQFFSMKPVDPMQTGGGGHIPGHIPGGVMPTPSHLMFHTYLGTSLFLAHGAPLKGTVA